VQIAMRLSRLALCAGLVICLIARSCPVFADSASGGVGGKVIWQAAVLGWPPGLNPNNALIIASAAQPIVIQAIRCRLEITEGAAATMSIYKAPAGTLISAGGATILHSGSFNANAAAGDQLLTLVGGAADNLAIGDSVGVRWTGPSTVNTGACTVYFTPL